MGLNRQHLLVLYLCMLWCSNLLAQAPAISYPSPQVYKRYQPINTLSPVNSGGAVPEKTYGEVSTYAGVPGVYGGSNGPSATARFYFLGSLATGSDGAIYIADAGNNHVRKISTDGMVSLFAGSYQGSDNGPLLSATFYNPRSIAINSNDEIFIGDYYNYCIRKLSGGNVTTLFNTRLTPTVNSYAGLAFDSQGNLYFTEDNNNKIGKFTVNGTYTVVAGNGSTGAIDGQGIAATFNHPVGIVIDKNGNLFIADANNNRIRKVTPAGEVSTFAGNGQATSVDGVGINASFNWPEKIIIDVSGNFIVSEMQGNKIRLIKPDGTVTTIAGTGVVGLNNGAAPIATFNGPRGLTIDGNGDLLVGDQNNYVIRKIQLNGYSIDKPLPQGLVFDSKTGNITGTPTVSWPKTTYTVTAHNAKGTGTATLDIEVNAATPPVTVPPNISYQTPKVYFVTVPIAPLAPTNTGGAVPATLYGSVTTFAGGTQGDSDGQGSQASFNNAAGVAVDINNNIYIADTDNNKIRKITATGQVSTYAGSGSYSTINGPALAAAFKKPVGITVDLDGNVYVSQPDDDLIRRIAADGTVTTFAGVTPGGFGNGPLATASFKRPTGLFAMPNGDIIVVDQGNHAIRRISNGLVTTVAGTGISSNTNGPGATASFNNPVSVTADAAGNLYVSDSDNTVIRKIDLAGVVTNFAGSGIVGNADGQAPVASFNGPFGLAIDGTLNAYVADRNNYTIRRIGNNNTVVVIAGNNVPGTTDGLYTAATFTDAQTMVKDYAGNLYVIDKSTFRVRKVVITGYTINRALPAGLVFDARTGVISGTPTASSPATDYIITAYNAGGSHTTTVNIRVDPIGLNFGGIPAKLICDADFDPGATSNFPITYTSSNPAVATIVNGRVHITGLGTTLITANNGYINAQQSLIVMNPVPPIANVTSTNNNTCQGSPITFSVTPKGQGYSYRWFVNGVNNGIIQDTFSSNVLNNGDQVTSVVTNNTACIPATSAPSVPVVVLVRSKATIQITIATSVTSAVCPGTPISITSSIQQVPDQPIYKWQVNGSEVNATGPVFTSTAFNNGDEVTCTITSAGNCLINQSAVSNTVTIPILEESECIVKIPNTFTPNGDGYNDTWNVYLPSGYNNALISVFNRHGVRVYQSVGYGQPWNGTTNGRPLPAGTYYYIIEPKGVAQRQSGSVAILR